MFKVLDLVDHLPLLIIVYQLSNQMIDLLFHFVCHDPPPRFPDPIR